MIWLRRIAEKGILKWQCSSDLADADFASVHTDINQLAASICIADLKIFDENHSELSERIVEYIISARKDTPLGTWFPVPDIELERVALKLCGEPEVSETWRPTRRKKTP